MQNLLTSEENSHTRYNLLIVCKISIYDILSLDAQIFGCRQDCIDYVRPNLQNSVHAKNQETCTCLSCW